MSAGFKISQDFKLFVNYTMETSKLPKTYFFLKLFLDFVNASEYNVPTIQTTFSDNGNDVTEL
jgi:hypothetical protein